MKFVNYGVSYLLWLVTLLFGLWLVFISRNTWLAVLGFWFIQGSPTRAQQSGFFDKILLMVLGFAWLILMVATEAYFRKGVKIKQLFPRFAKVSGPILLIIFMVDAFLGVVQGLAIIGWYRLVVILIELVAGILLVRCGWRKSTLEKTR